MKSIQRFAILATLFLLTAGTIPAQQAPKVNIQLKSEKAVSTTVTDTDELPFPPPMIEDRENVFGDKSEKDSILQKMEYSIGFIAEGGSFDNADLRTLNESNNASIDDTDDAVNVALSRFFVNFYFPLGDTLYFRTDIFKNGFWGHDQLAGGSSNNSSSSTPVGSDPFAFGSLYLEAILWKNNRLDISTRIGRQFFSIGGTDTDYMLRDYLDAVTMQIGDSTVGTFHLLLLDVFQMAGDSTDHINYVGYFSHDSERVENFNGDAAVLRHGLVYESRDILDWKSKNLGENYVQARGYFFLVRYGAVNQGGADRSNNGATGNFSDNDFSTMSGLRVNSAHIIPLSGALKNLVLEPFVDTALSAGIDRRLPNAAGEVIDANTNGFAFHAGIASSLPLSQLPLTFQLDLDGFYATGATYDEDGQLVSHGFVSFKGNQMGGILYNRFYGSHPTGYTDDDGIDDYPHDYDRKAGSAFFHTRLGMLAWDKVLLSLDHYAMADTSQSEMWSKADSEGTTDTITSATLRAQERLGKFLGHEFNVGLDYFHNKYWTLYVKGGIFLPGEFYSTPGIVADSPYGSDAFWGMLIGSRLVF